MATLKVVGLKVTNNEYNWAKNDNIMRFTPSCTLFFIFILYLCTAKLV